MRRSKQLAVIAFTCSASVVAACKSSSTGGDTAVKAASGNDASAATSVYKDVWAQVKAVPYARPYPDQAVKLLDFSGSPSTILFDAGHFLTNAKRTLTSREDYLPKFDKLVRPNGACLTGTWSIDTESPYGGYFAKGAKAVIIARGSVAFDEVNNTEWRSFGMAGKLYPTEDAADPKAYQTANFFAIDDNTGTSAGELIDAKMTNEPKASKEVNNIKYGLTHAALLAAMKIGQETAEGILTQMFGHSGMRQLYQIAQLGSPMSKEEAQAISPKHMQISSTSQPIAPAAAAAGDQAGDFREIFDLSRYKDRDLSFAIAVDGIGSNPEEFTRIGKITVTDTTVSEGCDHNLHFAHPIWVKD